MSGQTVQMNPYTAKTQRCVVHRSRFDSWCNQEGVGSTLAAAKIVNNFNPQNWDFGKNKRYQDEISLIPFYYEIKGNFYFLKNIREMRSNYLILIINHLLPR